MLKLTHLEIVCLFIPSFIVWIIIAMNLGFAILGNSVIISLLYIAVNTIIKLSPILISSNEAKLY